MTDLQKDYEEAIQRVVTPDVIAFIFTGLLSELADEDPKVRNDARKLLLGYAIGTPGKRKDALIETEYSWETLKAVTKRRLEIEKQNNRLQIEGRKTG